MRFVILATLLLAGCSSHHPYMSKPASLAPPQYHCDLSNNCELVQAWEPAQLTPGGCLLHKMITLHTAQECKR